jgi:hypothetical protein
MDDSNYNQLISDIEAAPGIIVGVVMVLIAIFVFSSYARGQIKFRLSQLAWTAAGVGTVLLCGWGFITTYLV